MQSLAFVVSQGKACTAKVKDILDQNQGMCSNWQSWNGSQSHQPLSDNMTCLVDEGVAECHLGWCLSRPHYLQMLGCWMYSEVSGHHLDMVHHCDQDGAQSWSVATCFKIIQDLEMLHKAHQDQRWIFKECPSPLLNAMKRMSLMLVPTAPGA